MDTKDMRTVEAYRLFLVAPSNLHAVLTFSHLPYDGSSPMKAEQTVPLVLSKEQVRAIGRHLLHVAEQMPDQERPPVQ